MSFKDKVSNFVKKNDTTILTTIGVADGLFVGGYLWYRTGQKVQKIIADKEQELNAKLTFKQKFKATWKVFLLPVINTTVSAGVLIYSARVGNKRLAALGAAYNIAEATIQKYAEKTKEVVGDKKAEVISQKVAEENFNSSNGDIATVYNSELVVQEPETKQKFTTTWDKVDLAIMKTQRAAEQGDGRVSLSYFIRELGLEPSELTDMVGFDINKNGDIYITHTSFLDKDGIPCGGLDYHGSLVYYQ